MAGEWRAVQFGDLLVNGTRNGVYKSKPFHGSGVKIVNMGELFANPRLYDVEMKRVQITDSELEKSSLLPGDLLFARRSLVAEGAGKCSIVMDVTEPTTFESSIIRARPDRTRADSLFLYYMFSSPQGRYLLGTILRQVAVSGITGRDLTRLRVPTPPLPEQQAIACILGALDDKIELNRRMNQTLEAMARAIFKSWFVDFEPVRAKAAGKRPTGLAPHVAKLFPDEFEDSELGEIPKGWRVGKIDDIAYINARTLGKRDTLDVIDYIEISEVMRGDVSAITRYSRGEEPSRARWRLQHGDTALSTVRPDRGSYFLCLNPPETLIASTGFAVLTPKDGNWAFLYALATRPEVGQELGRLADGGAYPAVRPGVVGGLIASLPNESGLIAAYDSAVQPLFQRAEINKNENRYLAALRDALLPKLICGELRVPDAERMVRRYV